MMSYDHDDTDMSRSPAQSRVTTKSKRDALDEFMWEYHDRRHTGAYVECDGCTQVHMFMQDNPDWNRA